MARRDEFKMKTPYLVDRDENTFVGIDLPFHKGDGSDGMFAATTTTLAAVKNNVKNLLLTELGERVMQPNLGIKLKRFLFDPYTEEVANQIKASISATFSFWLPFVDIINIEVGMNDSLEGNDYHTLNVFVQFALTKDPSSVESVQVTIGE